MWLAANRKVRMNFCEVTCCTLLEPHWQMAVVKYFLHWTPPISFATLRRWRPTPLQWLLAGFAYLWNKSVCLARKLVILAQQRAHWNDRPGKHGITCLDGNLNGWHEYYCARNFQLALTRLIAITCWLFLSFPHPSPSKSLMLQMQKA